MSRVQVAAPAGGRSGRGGLGPPPAPALRRARPYLAAYALYQCLALAAWWHLLAAGLAGSLPTGSADPGQEVWFLGWFAHALAAGTDPFVSHALYAPDGINLLSNTSMDLLGLLFAPITLTAGPVASFGVAALLAPALSALGGFALCRRYTAWPPAPFVGGLAFGFGPFVATDLRYGHLDLTWLVLPPLIWCALDELVRGRPRRPRAVGALLGALVVAQFFVSTEMLAVTVLTCAVALGLLAAARPSAVRPALRAAGAGLAVGAAVAVASLAYPLWVVVAGPRHVTGPVWPHIGDIATTLASTVQPHAETAGVAFISGGDGGYLGVGLLVVVALGALAWRPSPAGPAALTGLAAWILSLGHRLHVHDAATSVALPAAVLGHLPLVDSLVPARFAAAVDLCAAVALAVVLDRIAAGAPAPRMPRLARPAAPAGRPAAGDRRRALRVGAGAAVAAVALVPLGLLPFWPYPARALRQPAALRAVLGPAPAPGRAPAVAVVYPDGAGDVAQQMAFQALDGFGTSLAAGYGIVPGPGGRATQQPAVDGLWLVLAAGTLGRLHLPLSATTAASVRASLARLGASEVLVLPGATGSAAERVAMTECLGAPTGKVGGAALWRLGQNRPLPGGRAAA